MKQNISGPVTAAIIAVVVVVALGIFYFKYVNEPKATPEQMKASMDKGMAEQMKMRMQSGMQNGRPPSGQKGP